MTLPIISFSHCPKSASFSGHKKGIHPRVLKECASERASVFARLFSFCLKTRYSPSWNHALVHLIPKMGDLPDPSNYRLIALTSSSTPISLNISKINLLSDHQYGFCEVRSTGDILPYLTNVWSSSVRNSEKSCIVAFDIS